MSVKDSKVAQDQGVGATIIYVGRSSQIPASQTDYEVASVRLPDICDWWLKSAYVFARTEASTPEINIQDDGVDIGTNTVIVGGAQTLITGVGPVAIKGGSELQVVVTTAGGETVDDLGVTFHLEPLRLYARTATPAPS